MTNKSDETKKLEIKKENYKNEFSSWKNLIYRLIDLRKTFDFESVNSQKENNYSQQKQLLYVYLKRSMFYAFVYKRALELLFPNFNEELKVFNEELKVIEKREIELEEEFQKNSKKVEEKSINEIEIIISKIPYFEIEGILEIIYHLERDIRNERREWLIPIIEEEKRIFITNENKKVNAIKVRNEALIPPKKLISLTDYFKSYGLNFNELISIRLKELRKQEINRIIKEIKESKL